MSHRLVRVALTGGIATGKSYCMGCFQALGIPTIDADLLARQAVWPGTPGLAEVVKRFGPGIVDRHGLLDRAALGHIVFADAEARRDLERIVHPHVYEAVRRWIEVEEARAGDARVGHGQAHALAVADIPLLYESGGEREFDCVVVVACRPEQQLARLMARDHLSQEVASQRIATQWPIEEKRARADYVIDTSGTFAETESQLASVTDKLRFGVRS